MFCKNCGKQIDDNANFCEYCGNSTSDNPIMFASENNPVSNKSKKKIIIISVISALILLIAGLVGFLIYEEIQVRRMSEQIRSHSMINTESDIVNTTVNSEQTTAKQIQTTKSSTTTTTAITTAAKSQEKAETSGKYLAYLTLLNAAESESAAEYGTNDLLYYQYYLYDINHDGVYELLIHIGTCEADAMIGVYSIDDEEGFAELGEIGGGHTILTEKDKKLYANYCHQGYQLVNEIQMVGWHDVWSVTQETVFEKDDLSDYAQYGKAIKWYDISDKSAVEALCPKEFLEDKPYVNAYAETYSLSGRDGAKVRLFLDGDFSAVSFHIYNQEYTSEVEYYSKDEFDDYIEINFNPFAQPPSHIYITPYSAFGVAGDVVTCDIPLDASGTISTGGTSIPINNIKGQINCHGGTVAGFTTEYVVNGGAVGTVRNSLGHTWHVTAKNQCYNYGITWYELWDSDDGDYYGWVDSDYIDFY